MKVKRLQGFTSLSVSLPKGQRAWVEKRIASGGYGTVSHYVRELIRQDQKALDREELERKLLAALKSHERVEVTPEYWRKKRRELRARVSRQRKAR